MEGELDLPAPSAEAKFFKPNLSRPISINPDSIYLNRSFNTTSTCGSNASSSSSSPPEMVKHVQAAFKRQRPIGLMQTNVLKPRRVLVSQRETSKDSTIKPHPTLDVKRSKEVTPQDDRSRHHVQGSKNVVSVSGENQVDASITLPSEWGSTVSTHDENNNAQKDPSGLSTRCGSSNAVASSFTECANVLAEGQKKVHFATESNTTSRGADDRMATGLDDLLSHLDSLAMTEFQWDMGNQVDTLASVKQDSQHHTFQSMEIENNFRSEGGTSSIMARRTIGNQDQLHQFRNFLQDDSSNVMTQSSAIGSSCVTSTLINPNSAPMVSSTTYCSKTQTSGANLGAAMSVEVDKSSGQSEKPKNHLPQECGTSKDSSHGDNNSTKGNTTGVQYGPTSSKVPSLDPKLENAKSEKLERGVSGKVATTSRKKGYDTDMFFKVSGKLYQRLGKIGSGGSSEVHKVISSDCKIYALKKIKLKGRDYATAYGFCQEIEYLNRLKGMNNIIQLIDYEVTDRALLQEVMNGSLSNKDGKVKDDGCIYMVLEYGEIDLAHMLSHKWKELDGSNTTIDENWLRFYWQQILLAVNTIHEERIVHSDLKPANFLLVRGALKLIDFGIAKAIMSDTTNIIRDSQVGTLSYMSPEAFLCNDIDANGNAIKCGRPSDIWSLGCILYQMVYGRTPFSEYKTFWAKFKVITDPNYEIIYEPVSNPWLLDLMKKCLAWDRNERWRIPQLLQHPFLVPPVPPQVPSGPDQSYTLFQLVAEVSPNDQKASMLCSELQNLIRDPRSVDSSISREELRKILCKISTVCFQLQKHLRNL